MSPRSSTASTSISTGSAASTVAPSPGRSHVTVGAVVVGAGRQQVRHRPAARARCGSPVEAICSRPKPSETESRVEMIAAPSAFGYAGVVRVDALLAERPLRSCCAEIVPQPRRDLQPRVGRAGQRVLRRLLRRAGAGPTCRARTAAYPRADRPRSGIDRRCDTRFVEPTPLAACAGAEPPLAPVVRHVELAEERRVRPVVVTRLVRRVVEAVHRVLPPAVVGVRVQTDAAAAAGPERACRCVVCCTQRLRPASSTLPPSFM